jgi:hypothetical protein
MGETAGRLHQVLGRREVRATAIGGAYDRAPVKAVRAVDAALNPLAFDRVYSHHWERVIQTGAKQILRASVERYIAARLAATNAAD